MTRVEKWVSRNSCLVVNHYENSTFVEKTKNFLNKTLFSVFFIIFLLNIVIKNLDMLKFDFY